MAVAPVHIVPVANIATAPDTYDETDTINQTLFWIGFRNQNQRIDIMEDSMENFDDVRLLTEKDIAAMATERASRTNAAAGKIVFGTRRTKLMKALVHWVHDFYRISAEPDVSGMNEADFRGELSRALSRADIRESIRAQTKTAAAAATPGPLESERKWKQWEEKFVNYTRCHLGTSGIPLSYVIREEDDPDDRDDHPDFITRTIYQATHDGEHYAADRLSVFNMIVSFTTGHPSGDWIKTTLRYSDGRRSMKAL